MIHRKHSRFPQLKLSCAAPLPSLASMKITLRGPCSTTTKFDVFFFFWFVSNGELERCIPEIDSIAFQFGLLN